MYISKTDRQQNRTHQLGVLLAPILVVIIGHFAARFFTTWIGQWAWVGSSLVYWGSMVLMIWFLGDRRSIRQWFAKPQGSKWWVVLAMLVGLISFPLLLIPNFHVMNSFRLILAWFLFAVFNATCEEAFWRGFLLDETRHWPRAFGVIYSSLLFITIHPLMLGVFSKIQAYDPANPAKLVPFLLILVVISLAYCAIYLKTKSLRLAILSHFLSDLGNLSIFLFMNLVKM